MVKLTLICFCMVFAFSRAAGQSSLSFNIDIEKERLVIDSLDKQFSKHYFNGDSLALFKMYAKNASLGSARGNDILLAWGRMIRNSIKNDARHIVYTTNSLTTDSEFLVEIGKYEMKNDSGTVKGKGKYVVVWKYEDGVWKLYRDIGL